MTLQRQNKVVPLFCTAFAVKNFCVKAASCAADGACALDERVGNFGGRYPELDEKTGLHLGL